MYDKVGKEYLLRKNPEAILFAEVTYKADGKPQTTIPFYIDSSSIKDCLKALEHFEGDMLQRLHLSQDSIADITTEIEDIKTGLLALQQRP
ncbi:hypothetical protein KY366_03380 [Candidatus Woesearchaeota archaeon]|nr:hypothetical protein [Candidatus Woesearchaeota archaeon]